jgi:hypothetical protein
MKLNLHECFFDKKYLLRITGNEFKNRDEWFFKEFFTKIKTTFAKNLSLNYKL